ncbi:hypothetical protein HSX11_01285 [Oxalobacteraceae bacterium]|nr:hypothetical protein [Oxalobacteraceae bacterium]
MSAPSTPPSRKYLMPRDVNATGPQNEAERRLYELVMEGINSGPAKRTTVAELIKELRSKLATKR